MEGFGSWYCTWYSECRDRNMKHGLDAHVGLVLICMVSIWSLTFTGSLYKYLGDINSTCSYGWLGPEGMSVYIQVKTP